MLKRGQISIFITLGILILSTIIYSYYLLNDTVQTNIQIRSRVWESLDPSIKSCYEEKAKESIYLMGHQGGYILNTPLIYETEQSSVAYHLYDYEFMLPSKEEIEVEIENYLNNVMEYCYSLYSYRSNNGPYSNFDANVVITPENIMINTMVDNYSLTSFFDISLGSILAKEGKIIRNLVKGDDYFDFVDLELDNFPLTLFPVRANTIIYSLHDTDSEPPFVYNFAVLFKPNRRPFMEFIPDFSLSKGDILNYTIITHDDGQVQCYSTSRLVEIDNNTLYFDAKFPGEFPVIIGVKDEQGLYFERQVLFMVKDG